MRKSLITAALIAATVPMAASAGMLAAGDYQIKDYDGHRSVWTSGGDRGMIEGTGLWSFLEDAIFSYRPDSDGPKAVLSATAEAIGSPGLFLDFNLEFDMSAGGDEPYCQQGNESQGPNRTCVAGGPVEFDDWSFFHLTSGTAVGTGLLDGVAFDLFNKSGHNPQAGNGANALENTDLGFSMWFDWMSTGVSEVNGYHVVASGNGDINSDLEAVPLPAAGWMLIAGLGGLTAAGRRKKA